MEMLKIDCFQKTDIRFWDDLHRGLAIQLWPCISLSDASRHCWGPFCQSRAALLKAIPRDECHSNAKLALFIFILYKTWDPVRALDLDLIAVFPVLMEREESSFNRYIHIRQL